MLTSSSTTSMRVSMSVPCKSPLMQVEAHVEGRAVTKVSDKKDDFRLPSVVHGRALEGELQPL